MIEKQPEYLTIREGSVQDLEIDDAPKIKGTDKVNYLGCIITNDEATEE